LLEDEQEEEGERRSVREKKNISRNPPVV